MSPSAWKRSFAPAVLALCGLAAVGAGCAGAPPVPDSAKQRPEWAERHLYDQDGWLMNRLLGRQPAARGQARSEGVPADAQPIEPTPPSGGVTAASASEPLGARPGAALPEPVLPQRLPEETLPPPPGELLDLGPDAARAYPPPGHRPPTPLVGPVESDQRRPGDDDEPGFQLSGLNPKKIYQNAKAAVGYGPDEKIARSAYQEGEALFREKKYAEASEKFRTAAARWPDSILEEDALFMLGESLFFSDRYPKAHDTYAELLKKYENTRYLETVVSREFSIGRYWEQLYLKNPDWVITPNLIDKTRPMFDAFSNAIQTYQNVRMYDPTGPLADDALMATANAHFLKGEFENAAYYYDQLRKEYPGSEHQKQAHLLGIQAKLRVYQGRDYDGVPLDEAKQIAEQALTQFGHELGAERQRVEAIREQIIEKQAERDWAMAEFYEAKRSYKSARYYYQAIIRDYPLTRHAEMAKARLEQIRDKPDDPPNYFGWLEVLDPKKKKK